jgi:hypothetical protein
MAMKASRKARQKKSDAPPRTNPSDFDKKTTPVRERMVREMKEMTPAERIRKGP